MTVAFLAKSPAGAPLAGLTPTWIVYLDASTGGSQSAPSISDIGLGNYKFSPTGSNPCGLIDLGGSASPRYLVYAGPSAYYVLGAFNEFGEPLAGLTPTWTSLKLVSDGSNYSQPGISALSNGLYKTTFISDHVTGAIDLGATAYPRYLHYDSENLYAVGELYGFSSQREVGPMWTIAPGETDTDRKTVFFRIYDSTGLPASGNGGEGAVCSPGAAEKQVNRDLGGFVNAAGTFAHVADGLYKYTFDNAEVSLAGGDGNTIFRVKVTGFRVATVPVRIRSDADTVVTRLGTPAGASVSADIAAVSVDISDVKSDTSLLPAAMPKIDDLHQIGVGRWKVQGTQLLLYDSDNTTVLFAFNLKDDTGAPSATKIFERAPVP